LPRLATFGEMVRFVAGVCREAVFKNAVQRNQPHRQTARAIPHHVERDAIQPGSELQLSPTLRVIPLESAISAHERILSRLFGVTRATGHAQRKAVEPVLIRQHHTLEVTLQVRGEQCGQAGVVVHLSLKHCHRQNRCMPMDQSQRAALIKRYTEGHQAVLDVLAGLSEADLDTRTEGWTAREIVHHLADSEMTSAIRLRRLLAEDQPIIDGYDEEQFSRVLHYGDRPIEAALDAFAAARRTTAEILARMSDDEWSREGTHSESGRYTAEDWLRIYAAHAHDHADQIGRATRRA
jgi:hypothetical protein